MPLLLVLLISTRLLAQTAASLDQSLDQSLSMADKALKAGNVADAEGRYAAVAQAGDALLHRLPASDAEARRRVTATVTAACFNLGILAAQRSQFGPAATWLARAATLTPDYPKVQFALGTAYFNGGRYADAIDPLSRAIDTDPATAAAALRMLALARFHTDAYDEAVRLLRDDPKRALDPSLQYVYGVALVRSDRAAEAADVFSRLLRSHRDSAPLNVVLGMAYAEQGDYEAARQALKRALAIDPNVREANATLGLLAFKQGHLPEAEAALRTELKAHPDDIHAAHLLATVLDLDGKQQEAATLLREVLKARPEHANARYLLGKILLTQGRAAEAIEHLEVAARLSPDAANVHYQLAQACTKAGRGDQAAREFEIYRQLKDTQRERGR
jgi:tetratricopeptide (TPR) repeat protein